jgi:L-alanine-DL-glutamate epimerase-like enolase superfamily enzyme
MGAAAHRMALTDLTCRRLGVSLSALYGRVRDAVPVYVTGGAGGATVEAAVEAAMRLYERGFRAFKSAVSGRPIEEDAARLLELRTRLPDDVSLMFDALQRWSLPQAIRASEVLADVGLTWLEDPIEQSDHAGYEQLCGRSPVPIATGENEVRASDVVDLADAGVAYLIVDLMRIGGFERWLEVAAQLNDGPATLVPHLFPHMSLQLVATLRQRVAWMEWVPWFDELVDYEVKAENGLLHVPDVVGAGFSPNPDGLERNAVSDWIPLT